MDPTENLEQNFYQNLEQNVEQNLDQNFEQNLDQNFEQNLDQNFEQNLDQKNFEQNLDQNFEQNLDQNFEKNVEENFDDPNMQLCITIEQDGVKFEELSSTDMVTLDEKLLKTVKLANQNTQQNADTSQIELWKKELPQLYTTLYDTSIYSKIEDNAILLTYFKKLKNDLNYKEHYESLNKIFVGAFEIRKAIEAIKVLHTDLNARLNEIKTRIVVLAPTFRQAVSQSYQYSTTSDSNALVQRLRLIDQVKMGKCQELIENLGQKQEALKALYEYSQKDREHLAEILGSRMTELSLDPYSEKNLKTLKDEMEASRKVLDSMQARIHENEKLLNIERAKMEYLEKVNENNDREIRLLDQELQKLKDNVVQNEDKKREILEFYTDPKRLNSKRKERENLRNELNQQYTTLITKTSEENNKIIDEIKKIKDVAKHFHLIFIIDESGSMSGGPYNQVMSSVEKVINIRKALPLTKDKMSLIKFNNEAKIEILNKSVNDEFKVSPIRGGGTTFVKPLECLVEILRDIDFDVEIPIVLFLSDGQGEPTEKVLEFIKNKILKDPSIGNDCSNNENMLFFTIGFGDEADKKTLEEMAKAFNQGKTFTSIGRERLHLYHHVKNEDQLVAAFTVYEKLFAFQKNILDTKREMLDQNLALAAQTHNRNSNALDELYAREDAATKHEERKGKLVGADLEAFNNVYNEQIEKCNSYRKKILNTNKANNEEYKLCQNQVDNYQMKILDAKREFSVEQAKFDNWEKNYMDFIEQCSKFNTKLIKSFEKDEAFENLVAKLRNEYGVEINETQKIHFKNHLVKFLNEFKDLIEDSIKLEDRSSKITNEYNEVVSRCKDMDDQLNTFAEVTNREIIKSKIWAMFVYRYYDKDMKIRSKVEKMSDTEKKEILWKILFGKQSNLRKPKETKKKKTNQGNQHKQDKKVQGNKHKKDKTDQSNQQKQDKTDQDACNVEKVDDKEEKNDNVDNSSDDSSSNSSSDSTSDSTSDSSSSEDENDHHYYLQKAFNSLFSLISVEEFFIKNEEIDLCDKFFEIYLQKIQDSIEDLKGLKRDVRKDPKQLKKLESDIEKKYKERNKLNRYKSEKLKILGSIKEKIKVLKADYYEARVVFELENIFKSIEEKYIPRVEALKSAQRQVNNRAIKN